MDIDIHHIVRELAVIWKEADKKTQIYVMLLVLTCTWFV
jgi:hypothetical protein